MKILIAVQSCQRDQKLHQRIRESSWAWDCPYDIRFFMGGDKPPALAADELWFDMPDGYDHISTKIQYIFRWAVENKYDYVMEIGNDVDVNVGMLTQYADGNADYVGEFCGVVGQKHFDKNNLKWYFNYAGGGYLLSQRAVKRLIATPPDDWVDDRWVAQVFGMDMIYGKIRAYNKTDLSTHTEQNRGKCRICMTPIKEDPLCEKHGGPGWIQ